MSKQINVESRYRGKKWTFKKMFTVTVRQCNHRENTLMTAYYDEIDNKENLCKKITAGIFVEIHTHCDDSIIPPLVDWMRLAGQCAGSDPIAVMKSYAEKNL